MRIRRIRIEKNACSPLRRHFCFRLQVWVWAASLAALLITPNVLAQDFTGIRGAVKDPSGAAVAGVKVSVKEEAKGLTGETVSNASGDYELRGILPGKYTVTAELSGFKKFENTGVIVYAQQPRRVDITLAVGEVVETISVTEQGEVLNTDTAAITYTTAFKEVYYNNVAASLVYKLADHPGAEQRSQIHGAYATNASFEQDGIITRAYGSFRAPQEVLQEVHLKTLTAPAEYQHAGTVIGVGKGGTNQFHGEFFVNYANPALNALPRNSTSRPKPQLANDSYSYEFGGPVFIPKVYDGRNKTFFHFLYQPTKSFVIEPINDLTYPTVRQRTGDLTELVPFTPQKKIINPFTGQQFVNNIIPESMWSPAGRRLLNLIPVPQNGNLVNNYATRNDNSNTQAWYHYKFDHQISKSNTVSVSHFRYNNASHETAWDSGPFDCGRDSGGKTRGWSFSDSHSFSATVINEFRLAKNSQTSINISGCAGNDLLAKLGVSLGGRASPPPNKGAPQIVMQNFGRSWGLSGSGYTAFDKNVLGGQQGGESDSDATSNWHLKNNLSINVGTHLIKTGFSLIHLNPRSLSINANSWGKWIFTGNFTGSDLGDMLLGLPYRSMISGSRPVTKARGGDFGFFLQDDWKITPKLTLTPGIRFQHYGPPSDATGLWYNFDLEKKQLVVPDDAAKAKVHPAYPKTIPIVTAAQAGYPSSLFNFKKMLWEPRLGLAWRPAQNWVVRLGYGMYHAPLVPDSEGQELLGAGFSAGPYQLTESFGPNEIVNGVPKFTYDNAFPSLGSVPLQNVSVLRPNLRRDNWPVDQQWNVTVEREIWKGTVASASYVGSKGTHWPYSYNAQKPAASTIPFTAARKPYGAEPYNSITVQELGGNSTNRAFEFQLTRQFSSGLYLRGWYENKTVQNDVSAGLFGWNGPGGAAIEDPFNRSRDKGWMDGVAPHRARITAVWDLPFGKGKKFLNSSKLANQVLGGWTVSPIGNTNGHSRITPGFAGFDSANVGSSGGRPDLIPGCDPNKAVDASHLWRAACFTIPKAGTYGNAPRGILQQPWFPNLDLNAFKIWYFKENGPYLKFEIYAANVINHTNLSGPADTTITSPVFGLYSSTYGTRSVYFRARIGF
ncbi:MAG: hypothetical protein EXQ58_00715 [Acidobacteria bacterium]|nr:hypothetical protein [Acidobacteriota bacterium]